MKGKTISTVPTYVTCLDVLLIFSLDQSIVYSGFDNTVRRERRKSASV